MQNRPILQLVALKSFGDFVIALRSVQRLEDSAGLLPPEIVAGHHLRALASALGAERSIYFAGDPSATQVPAVYDIKKLGMAAAVRSLLELRQALSRCARDVDIRLFDNVGWRERVLTGGAQPHELPAAPNIYGAYSGYFMQQGHRLTPLTAPRLNDLGTALVVPASRIISKALPSQVVAEVVSRLKALGFVPQVALLEGEQIELPDRMPHIRLPRTFDSLIAAVRGASLVVSADSLAAHLGEFHSKPTFVVTPRRNEYWLPETAFADGGWCTFNNLPKLSEWLQRKSAQGVALQV